MRTKMLFFHLAYYILSLLIYVGFLYGSAALFRTSNLGTVIAITYGFLYLATPILIAVIMRFSLLKWYIDPLAAAEIPLFLYFGCVINEMNRSGIPFFDAILEFNEKLSADSGSGWFFLIGLFLFSLVASISFSRKEGKSISYKLISKIIS
ncbi:MAG: hypothetical protein E7455_08025 [Ruminococcaceae bacterium]|nr:hypothetical protein [Oscillospiraceae bacterium]